MTAIFPILLGAMILVGLIIMFVAAVTTCRKCNEWCVGPSDCQIRQRRKGLR